MMVAAHEHDHATGHSGHGCHAEQATARDAHCGAVREGTRDGKSAQPLPEGTVYTCPMHPQIRQIGPGTCPICGMALEPLEITAEAAPNHELADMSRRFWIGLVLTLPVFILEMGSHIPGFGLHDLVPPTLSTWIQFALSTPVVLWAGWPFFQRAWASLVSRNLSMFTLIALGTGAAYLYSLAATLAPSAFPAGFRGTGGTVP